MSVLEEHGISDMLWVLLQVKDSVCALDSTCVEAISLLEEEITRMPNSDETNVGVIQFRGSVLPIVDLRRLLGMQSRDQERRDFDEMLDLRKQDHIKWVDELKRCAHDHAAFHLATDPHNCAFGKWYYKYQPASRNLAFQMKKIEEPHRRLHESAVKVLSVKEDSEAGAARVNEILNQETDAYKAQILRLLDEIQEAFDSSHHNMIVVVSDGTTTCGLQVDEVLAVEMLEPIEQNQQPSCVSYSHLVSQVAQRKSDQELIMLLNHRQLLSTLPQGDQTPA